jgi:hypothetical protein
MHESRDGKFRTDVNETIFVTRLTAFPCLPGGPVLGASDSLFRMSQLLCRTLFALAALTLAGCASGVPPIAPPARIQGYCGEGHARPSGVASVMTSTDDKLLAAQPSERGIVREVKAATGVIEFWNEQLLRLPKTSVALGESDGYARVREIAVGAAKAGATTRVIYLKVRDHGFDRWAAMTAYDLQNVCIEGRREA